jgi:TolA-binding protein
MGAIQRGQRHLKDSRDKFRMLVEHYPDDSVAAHATYYLGNIHFLLGDYPSAVESLQRVIDRWPDSEFKAKALFKLGTSHLKAGKREKAIDSFVNLAYHHPESPLVADAMLTLAQYFSKKKFYHQAIGIGQAFTRKFQAHQKTGSMFLRLAGWLIMEKQLSRAVEVLEEAEKALPDSPHMPAYLYWHADCLFKTHGSRSDEYKKGIILLKRITYDYPDSKWAKYASARLAEVDTEG